MKQHRPSVTVHCWWPNWNILAAGLVVGAPGIGAALFSFGREFSWETIAGAIVGIFGLVYGLAYCHITVTPWVIQVRGSGFLKPYYSIPIEEVMIHGRWATGEQALVTQQEQAGLYIGIDEDWDTGVPYLELQFYGEDIPNCFRANDYARVKEAIALMLAQRANLEGSKLTD
ncbi:hypothetical protein [Hymenobacter metallilatus]|uniref:PH domain-containing protein n=1 Tax=Hymenobacter metallilatus TaxID=2493666 RepID=A0A428IXY5_9BACT|nr:hypothetical protein [Hymenobacter metallilatus]RSK23970.1 hypothetical protein EI290_21520 [Hymenobacter metallilatus]